MFSIFRDTNLIKLLRYLSPGYLRIGGTESDRLVFQENSSDSDNSLYRHVKPVNDTFFMTGTTILDLVDIFFFKFSKRPFSGLLSEFPQELFTSTELENVRSWKQTDSGFLRFIIILRQMATLYI